MKLLMRPIDAIVVFKGSGKPLPYKFRYTEPDGTNREVYVKRILTASEERFAGVPDAAECKGLGDGFWREPSGELLRVQTPFVGETWREP